MKLSLSGRLVEGAGGTIVSVAEFLSLARRCGYDAVDLRASQFGPAGGEAETAAVRAGLADNGLRLFEGQYAGDPCAGGEAEAAFVAFAGRVAGLGGEGIRMGGELPTLKRAAQLARPLGLRICYQMHTGGPFETIDGAAAAVAEVGEPNFGVMPEPANLALAAQPFTEDMFAPLAGRIPGVHVQTLEVREDGPDSLRLADGTEVRYARVPYAKNTQTDFGTFFAALRRAGFDGYVNELEPCPGLDDLEDNVRRAAAFLRQFVG